MEKIIPQLLGFIYYILESYCLCLIALTFIGFTPKRKRVILFAVIFGVSTFILRELLMPIYNIGVGLHSIILFILNLLFLSVIFRLPFVVSIICDLLHFLTAVLVETLTLVIYKFFGYTPTLIFSSVAFMNIFRGTILLLVSLAILVLKKTKFTLIPLTRVFGLNQDE